MRNENNNSYINFEKSLSFRELHHISKYGKIYSLFMLDKSVKGFHYTCKNVISFIYLLLLFIIYLFLFIYIFYNFFSKYLKKNFICPDEIEC